MTYKVLTICTGNICRSPMAEVLLKEAFRTAGIADVVVDSAGISDEESGNPMDRRAVQVLTAAGIKAKPKHQARKATAQDLREADLVIPMTAYHARAIRNQAKAAGATPEIRLMRSFDPAAPKVGVEEEHHLDVEDPWYGGMADFATCLAELQAATPGVVAFVKEEAGR